MKTLSWLAIVSLVAGASLVACGSDDDDNTAGSGGGTATGGTGGSAGQAGGAGEGGGAGEAGSGGSSTEECTNKCIADNPDGWIILVDAVSDCVCTEELCAEICAASLCADPKGYEPTQECANCALGEGKVHCMDELSAGCLQDTVCAPLGICLVGCSDD